MSCPCRFLLSFALFAMVPSILLAQTSDLAVTRLHISSDSTIVPPGITTSMGITVRNQDTAALPAGDSIWLSMHINGTAFTEMLVLSSPLTPSSQFYHNFGPDALYTFDDSLTSAVVTGTVHHLADTHSANDTLTRSYAMSVFAGNDWSINSVTVLSPNFLDSFDLDNGTNLPPPIDQAEVVLTNSGFVTYLQYTPIQYAITLGNDTIMVTGVLADSNVGPNGTTIRSIDNQALFPALPDSVGTYSLCAFSLAASDINITNDTGCYVFTLVDNYDPSDPANWPFGITEAGNAPFRLIGSATGFQLVDVDEVLTMRIFNVQGALVASEKITTSGASHALAAGGMYIIEFTNSVGNRWMVKQLRF